MGTAIRAKLRQQSGRLGNIMDLGDYYALGNQVLRKDLSQTGVSFELPTQGSGAALRGYTIKALQRNNLAASPLMLGGSSSNLLCVANSAYSNSASFVNSGTHFEQFDTFLDSTLGVTAGKRMVFCTQSTNQVLGVLGGFVDDDGSVTWSDQNVFLGGTFVDYRPVVLAETTGYVYLYCHSPVNSADDGSTLWAGLVAYDKKANVGYIGPSSVNWWHACPRLICKTDDGKLWFWIQPCMATNGQYLAVLDTTSNVLTVSAVDNTLNAFNGVHKVSNGTLVSNDPTKYKFYYAVDPNTVGGDITIGARYISKAGNATPMSFVGPAKNTCTITGGTIPGMYAAISGYSLGGEVDLWLFNDSGNEYLAVYSHANQDTTSAYSSNNKCPSTKHVLTVLKVNPTNPLDLQYMGSVSDNGFGTGQIFPMLVRSTDGKTIVVGNSGGFVVLRFNTATENFSYGGYQTMAITRMCLDKQSQLWVEDDSRNLFIFSPTTSNNVVVGFDVDTISYSGTPVNCNVTVGNFDLYGNRLSSQVTLKLSGAVFTSNGSDTITVTTSASADKLVPITVSSSNAVSVVSL